MSDVAADQLTGLEGITTPGRHGHDEGDAGVTLAVRQGLALAGVIARKGAAPALIALASEVLEIDLPATPRHVASGSLAVGWAGHQQWLAVATDRSGRSLEAQLARTFGTLASVCDLSDARVVLRLSGPRARDALAKGLPLDLDPRSFQPGCTALSVFGHIAVQIWQMDDGPTYDIAVFRSYAADLWHALLDAGAEYGVAT